PDCLVETFQCVETLEDNNFTFSQTNDALLSILDVDANEISPTDVVQVTLAVAHGQLTLGNLAGLTFIPAGGTTADGDLDPLIRFTSTVTAANAALQDLLYVPVQDYNNNLGIEELTISVNDLGHTGQPGSQTTDRTVSISVLPLNDAPVVQGLTAALVNEDSLNGNLVFDTANNNAFTITDVDAENSNAPDFFDGGRLKVTLTVSHGALTLGTTNSLILDDGIGSDGTLVFRGLPGDVTNALEGLQYIPEPDFNSNVGIERLTILVDDQGNTGDEPLGVSSLTFQHVVTVTVNPINDAPTIDGPVAVTVKEDSLGGALVFSAGTPREIEITDVDSSDTAPDTVDPDSLNPDRDGRLVVSLVVSNGALTLSGTTGLLPTDLDGSDGTLAFRGTAAQVNAALNGLTYTPDPDFNDLIGTEKLVITADDQGNTGDEPIGVLSLTDALTIPINVTPVNDAPDFSLGANPLVLEDAGLVTITAFLSNKTPGPITATDEATQQLNLQSVIVEQKTGNLDFDVIPTIDFASGDLIFQTSTDKNGTATVTVSVTDNGGIPNGGIDVVKKTFTINVTAVNDAPEFTLAQSTVTVDEDEVSAPDLLRVTSFATGFSGPVTADDEDDRTGNPAQPLDQYFVSVTSLTEHMAFDPGVNNDGLPAINVATGELTFRLAPNATGDAVMEVVLVDQGGRANGGVDTSIVGRFTIHVNAINDPPEFTPGGDVTVLEDNGLTIVSSWATGIRPGAVTSTDEANQTLTFSATVTQVSPELSFLDAPEVNSATGDLIFETNPNTHGTATVVVSLSDGFDTSPSTALTITVGEVNDPPIPTTHNYNVDEDTPLTIDTSDLTTDLALKDAPGPLNESAQPLEVKTVSALSSLGGLVVLTGSEISYTPKLNFFGVDTFTYEIEDTGVTTIRNTNGTFTTIADDHKRAVGTIIVTVAAVNDVPIAVNDPRAGHQFIVDEDSVLIVAGNGILNNDIDVDPTDTLTVLEHDPQTRQFLVPLGPDDLDETTGTFTYDPTQIALVQALNAGDGVSVPIFDTFHYRIKDDANTTSNEATVTITLLGLNDLPVTSDVSQTISQDGPLVPMSFVGDDADAEDDSSTLVFSIAGNLPANSGSVSNHGDGTFTFDPDSDFDDLIDGENRVVKFTYRATDKQGESGSLSTVIITVTGVNDAPTTADLSIETSEDGATTEFFPGDDVDSDDDPADLTYAFVNGLNITNEGEASINTNGSFTYDPKLDFQSLGVGQSAQVSFTYQATDNATPAATSNVSTVSITINGVNDAPSAASLTANSIEDGGTVTASFNGSDADATDGSSLTYLFVTGVPSGQGTLANQNDGTFTYSPGTGFQELAEDEPTDVTFRYRARDQHDANSSITVATVVVTGVNDAPTAASFSVSTPENAPVNVDFGGDDIDSDDTPTSLLYSIVPGSLAADSGSVTNNANGMFTFDPGADFDSLPAGESRVVSFAYEAVDKHGSSSDRATVSITVTGTNDAPVASGGTVQAVEDGLPVDGVLPGSDVDSNEAPDDLIYTVIEFPPLGSGSLTRTGNRTFRFDPGPDFQDLAGGETRDVSFTYQAFDRFGIVSNVGTMTVTVTGQNDVPIVADLSGIAATEDGPGVNGAFSVNDVDSDEDGSGISIFIDTPPAEGTVSVSGLPGDTEFTFSPGTDFQDLALNETRLVTFTYDAIDQDFARSLPGTVTVSVIGINDAPCASDVTGITATEDGGSVTAILLASDADSDETGSGLTYQVVQQPVQGLVAAPAGVGNPIVIFDPVAGFQDLSQGATQTVTFTYNVTDQHGAISSAATGTIVVTGVNDAPTASAVLLDAMEGGGVRSGNLVANDVDSEEDGSGLVYSIVSQPSEGSVSVSGIAGNPSFDFDPQAGFQDLAFGETRDVTFTYQVQDTREAASTATGTVTVTGVNDDPIANTVNVNATEDGNPVNGLFGGTDADSDNSQASLTYDLTNVLPVGQGTIQDNNNATFTFDPGSDFQSLPQGGSTTVSVTYIATDQHTATSADGTISVTVSGVNDRPVVQPLNVALNAGTTQTTAFDGDDVDTDDTTSSLTFSIVSPTAAGFGTLTNLANGSFSFATGSDFDGLSRSQSSELTFTYRATDSNGAISDLATATITVNGVNDAPTAQPLTLSAFEDGTQVGANFIGDDIDSDDGPADLVFSIVTPPEEGIAINNNDGTFTFNPSDDFQDLGVGQTRKVTFTYRATDSHQADSELVTVTISVDGKNDAPIAGTDAASANEGQVITIAVLGNDTPVDLLDTLTLVGSDGMSELNATVTATGNGVFTYNPTTSTALESLAAGQPSTDTFTYTIEDSHGAQAVGTVVVNVTGVNDAPSAVDDEFSVNANDSLTEPVPGMLAGDTDPDPNTTLTATNVSTTSSRGVPITFNAQGGFTYDPTSVSAFQALDTGEELQDRFTYQVSDGVLTSATATVTVTVSGVNDVPTANGEQLFVAEETQLVISEAQLLANDFDVDNDTLLVQIVTTDAALSPGQGSVIYTPPQDFNGDFHLVYNVFDGTSSAAATATLTVTPVNDAPVAQADQYTVAQGQILDVEAINGLLSNDSDVEQAGLSLTAVQRSLPNNGTVALNPDGSFVYTPDADFSGQVTFQYQAEDDLQARSALKTVTITVTGGGNSGGSGGTITWHSPTIAEDVNGDGDVSPLDILQIINTINADGPRRLPTGVGGPPYYDVNDDGFVTAADALIVINFLNSQSGSPEGEAADQAGNVVNVVPDAAIPGLPSFINTRARSTSTIFKVESGSFASVDQRQAKSATSTQALADFKKSDAIAKVIDDLARDLDEDAKHVQATDDLFGELGLFGLDD
ncbi:MAG: hypothetical protein CMJ64_23200, partial [Planctomycetaceae bacterium]|nr:hypothetical protein [Planctomycetaceae bacterium]